MNEGEKNGYGKWHDDFSCTPRSLAHQQRYAEDCAKLFDRLFQEHPPDHTMLLHFTLRYYNFCFFNRKTILSTRSTTGNLKAIRRACRPASLEFKTNAQCKCILQATKYLSSHTFITYRWAWRVKGSSSPRSRVPSAKRRQLNGQIPTPTVEVEGKRRRMVRGIHRRATNHSRWQN